MTVSVTGSHSQSYLQGRSSGAAGVQNVGPIGIGWMEILANATNDVAVFSLTGLLQSNSLAEGVFFQSDQACVITFTLASPSAATSKDPNQSGLATFSNSLTLVAGVITKAPVLFTAFKVTFPAAGTLYVGAR